MLKILNYPILFSLGFMIIPAKEFMDQKSLSPRKITIPKENVVQYVPDATKEQINSKIKVVKSEDKIKSKLTQDLKAIQKNISKIDTSYFKDKIKTSQSAEEKTYDIGGSFKKYQVRTIAKHYAFPKQDLAQDLIIQEHELIKESLDDKPLPSQISPIVDATADLGVANYRNKLIRHTDLPSEDSTILIARLILKVQSGSLLANLPGKKDETRLSQSAIAKAEPGKAKDDDLVYFDYSSENSVKPQISSKNETLLEKKNKQDTYPSTLAQQKSDHTVAVSSQYSSFTHDLLRDQEMIKNNFLSKEELSKKTNKRKDESSANNNQILTSQVATQHGVMQNALAKSSKTITPEIWKLVGGRSKKKEKNLSSQNLLAHNSASKNKAQTSGQVSNLENSNQSSLLKSGFMSENSSQASFYNPKNAEVNSETMITAQAIGLNSIKTIKSFDANFLDDLEEYKTSDLSGKVILNTSVVNSHGMRRVKLSAKGVWPTQMDIAIDEGSFAYENVVLFKQDYIDSLKLYEEDQDHRALALFRLNEDIEDIEIDGGIKYYLNKSLDRVDPSSASFILFKGLTPGNTIVHFHLAIGSYETSKIVYIPENDLYYDDPLIRAQKSRRYTINEKYLAAKNAKPLSFLPKLFENFFFDSKVKKIGLNKYKEGRTYLPLGSRNYYALNFKDEKIYFGTGEKTKISLPGLEVSDFMLDNLGVSDPMDKECVVQVNFAKQVEEVSYETYGAYGSTMGKLSYLSSRGDFVDQIEDEIEKAFLVSREQGVFFVKIKYIDQSYDYLQTFCSIGSYLVEQL